MNRPSLLPIIASAAALLTASARAAGPTEFAEIPWGSSPSAVRQAMSGQVGATFSSETPGQLGFAGGTFAGESAATWRFDFTDSKFRSASVSFAPRSGKDAKGFLNDQIEWRVLRLLEQKYGKPKKADDANHREYHWQFTDPLHPMSAKTIRLYHGWAPSRHIELTYADISVAAPNALKPKDDL